LPIFDLSLELGRSVRRHAHAAKAVVNYNTLEGAASTSRSASAQPASATAWYAPSQRLHREQQAEMRGGILPKTQKR